MFKCKSFIEYINILTEFTLLFLISSKLLLIELYLDLILSYFVSEEDYDAFCLAYMFTYRDFEMGTLGLAWTGDLKNAGGVCEKNGVGVKNL